MNKKLILTIGVLTVAGGILLVSKNPVMAYRGDSTEFGPNHTEERHSQMLEAFENKDFNGWKELMQDRGASQRIEGHAYHRQSRIECVRHHSTSSANRSNSPKTGHPVTGRCRPNCR